MENSTKTIIDKLNFKKYAAKLILGKPDDITEFETIEYEVVIKKDKYDLIFVFIFSLEEFSTYLKEVIDKQLLNDNGYIYIAYPKK